MKNINPILKLIITTLITIVIIMNRNILTGKQKNPPLSKKSKKVDKKTLIKLYDSIKNNEVFFVFPIVSK